MEIDKESQSATDALAGLQEMVHEHGGTLTVEVNGEVVAKVDGNVAVPSETAAAKSSSTEAAGARPPVATVRGRRHVYPPADDENLPSVDAASFLAALKYAYTACPIPDDQPAVEFVVFARVGQRLVFSARDGRRWHAAYLPAPEKMHQVPIALTRESIADAIKDLAHAVKRNSAAKVAFDWVTPLCWYVRYGAPSPMVIALSDFSPGQVPEEWEPPRFSPAFARESAVDFEAAHEAKARTWLGGGALVRRDEVDDRGRRHVVLVDSGGEELARAVLVPLGLTDGLPRDSQEEIPGTLTPAAAARKKATAHEPTPAGPAVSTPPDGHWRVERKDPNTGRWDTIMSGPEDEMSGYFDCGADLACAERLMRPDGTTARHREGTPGPEKPRAARAPKPSAKTKPAKGSSPAPKKGSPKKRGSRR
jgi:hypothetical protein